MAGTQRLVLDLPAEVFAKLEHAAAEQQRSVEDEALYLLGRAAPEDDHLPATLQAELAGMTAWSDQRLWDALQATIDRRTLGAWRRLLAQRARAPLSAAEEQRLDRLEERMQRHTLLRAEAALLLHERGHDVARFGAGA